MSAMSAVRYLLLGAALVTSLAGCAGLDVLHSGAQCPGGAERQVRLIRDQAELDAVWRGLSAGPQASPAPRLGIGQALLIADAERPSAGYGLSLDSRYLVTREGVASLRVRSATPSGITAQVVTRPCLLLAIPAGDYATVEVRDQDGRAWLSAPR